MTINILSNGHGEDQIACNLADALRNAMPNTKIQAFPLVGEGLEYQQRGYPPLFKNPSLPSQGFLRSFKDVYRDLFKGVIQLHWSQRAVLRQHQDATLTLCVGDVFCLIMATLAGLPNRYFVPTAKSDHFMKHSWVECLIMKRFCKAVYTRDDATAKALQRQQVKASYRGNPMFDLVAKAGPLPSALAGQVLIGLAPGSRKEALENFAYILGFLPDLQKQAPTLAFAWGRPDSIQVADVLPLLPEGWSFQKGVFTHESGTQVYETNSFPSVIDASRLIIGLAGTANEQAAYFGRPVICFEGFGPQSSKKRFLEQRDLMKSHIHFVEPRTHARIIDEITKQLALIPTELPRIGQQEKAAPQIIAHLLGTLS